MATHSSRTGSCLCKAVSFSATQVNHNIGVCHCNMCRKWSGGPYLGLDCGETVEFTGDVSRYDSSDWAERGFCRNCGTHLFYRFKEQNQYIIPAGAFDDGSELILDHQIFIDEKPAYYDFANETKDMTGAEAFEYFMAASKGE